MHINDSAFPIGAYTHSFGMETYIQKNTIFNKDTLLEFCRTFLHENLAFGDGIFVKETWQALSKAAPIDDIYKLDRLCHTMKIAKESRQGSLKMGRQFLETATPLSSSEILIEWQKAVQINKTLGHHAISYGIFTYVQGIPQHAAISSFLYSSVANLIHNAVRAIPLGQTAGVRAIEEILPDCEQIALAINQRSLDDLSNQAIGIELASMEHEHLFTRLFIS